MAQMPENTDSCGDRIEARKAHLGSLEGWNFGGNGFCPCKLLKGGDLELLLSEKT